MEEILRGIEGVAVYLDDIIVGGETAEEHSKRLNEVFMRLTQHKVKINEEKCKFNQSSVQYLGYHVTAEGIKTVPQKIEKILASETPKTTKALISYLCMLQYYHRFLPNLSSITKTLYNITKEKKFQWSEKAQKAFENTKNLLKKKQYFNAF